MHSLASYVFIFVDTGYVCTLFIYLIIVYTIVAIARPPENTTVCRYSNVTISCGYLWSSVLPVTWIINGTSFTQQEVADSPLYRLNNPTTPRILSLTVFSITSTTTLQCIVHSITNVTSTSGKVTVTNGMYVCTVHICKIIAILWVNNYI